MSGENIFYIDNSDEIPLTGDEILNANPDAKDKAEEAEKKRKEEIKGRIRSIYQLGDDEWWLADSIKPRKALLFYHGNDQRLMMPRGEVCSLVGSDGSGKSRILMQLCISIATGQRFLDTFIPESPGSVFYICGEEDDEEIKRRLFWAIKDSGVNKDREAMKLIGKNFRFLSQRGLDTRLQDESLNETDIAKKLLDNVREMANESPIALIILDPMSWFSGNDTEKDAIAATQFVRTCQRFTEVHGHPTVLVCHHTGKSAQRDSQATEDASTTDMRGSSGLSAAFRFGINVIKLKSPKGDQWRGQTFLKLVIKKNNYGPEDHEGIYLRIIHPGVVKVMDYDEIKQFTEARVPPDIEKRQTQQNGTKKKQSFGSVHSSGRSSYQYKNDDDEEQLNGRP